jgi:hypothetical protein
MTRTQRLIVVLMLVLALGALAWVFRWDAEAYCLVVGVYPDSGVQPISTIQGYPQTKK